MSRVTCRRLFPAPLALALLLSCVDRFVPPGDEVMGTFRFRAELLEEESSCLAGNPSIARALSMDTAALQEGFSFQGVFSRNREEQGGSRAWFTTGEGSRDAGFDGQYVEAVVSAPRIYSGCRVLPRSQDAGNNPECRRVEVQETLRVALLSASQSQVVEGDCSRGVPEPDGGVTGPRSVPTGFDAVRACGFLEDEIRLVDTSAQSGCPGCFVDVFDGGSPSCTIRFELRGERL